MASTNISGQAYFLMILTPVRPGEGGSLRSTLAGMDQRQSPLCRSGRTHFARWIVVADLPQHRAQPRPDHLDLAYLLFTSNFDGDLDSYLDELCEQLAPEAPELWGRCVGCPQPASGPALKTYLQHTRSTRGWHLPPTVPPPSPM